MKYRQKKKNLKKELSKFDEKDFLSDLEKEQAKKIRGDIKILEIHHWFKKMIRTLNV